MIDFILARVAKEKIENLKNISGSEQAEVASKFLVIARGVADDLQLPLGYVALRLAQTNRQLYELLYH